jgi:hypothetical protein
MIPEVCETCDALRGLDDDNYECDFLGDIIKENDIADTYCGAWIPREDLDV